MDDIPDWELDFFGKLLSIVFPNDWTRTKDQFLVYKIELERDIHFINTNGECMVISDAPVVFKIKLKDLLARLDSDEIGDDEFAKSR